MRKETKTERTKERILAAAMDEFGSKGYAASSLNNICNAGISKGLLYHNFKSKDDLFLACVRRCFNTLSEYLKEIIFQERRYQEKPIFQGLQKLWNAVRCAGIYIECNTYAAGMQQRY